MADTAGGYLDEDLAYMRLLNCEALPRQARAVRSEDKGVHLVAMCGRSCWVRGHLHAPSC